MRTALHLGPGDSGRPLTLEEFLEADYEEGHRYEIIGGRLAVSPMPNFPHDWIEQHVFQSLLRYHFDRPDVLPRVSNKCRVFVPDAEATTAPEPDVAAYGEFPVDAGPNVEWSDVSPLIVAEVMRESVEKDLVRNVDLYLRVPSIAEYWLFDIRDDPADPTLLAHRRTPDGWEVTEHAATDEYRTELLPGFVLPVRPTR